MDNSKNSKISFSLREKVGMRGLKSKIYTPALSHWERVFFEVPLFDL
jgi:hypothetical protein